MQNTDESDYPIFKVTSKVPIANTKIFNRTGINSSMLAT